MKLLLFNLAIISILYSQSVCSQTNDSQTVKTELRNSNNRINFFIISKRKHGKIDLATRYNVLRSKIRGLLSKRKLVSIVAADASQMSEKVQTWLRKTNSNIGTIWFDSHGMYKKGYSLFTIGKDEISYKTLADKSMSQPFEQLSQYTDGATKIVIGSCYGGATYRRASIDYKDTTRMNGDSLMIALGNIIKKGIVYGSESWVMTKPGLFSRKASTGGFPGRKLFLDVCYEPAWKNVGHWNQYKISDTLFQSINTVSLDASGNLVIRGAPYSIEKNKKEEIDSMLAKLEPNLYR